MDISYVIIQYLFSCLHTKSKLVTKSEMTVRQFHIERTYALFLKIDLDQCEFGSDISKDQSNLCNVEAWARVTWASMLSLPRPGVLSVECWVRVGRVCNRVKCASASGFGEQRGFHFFLVISTTCSKVANFRNFEMDRIRVEGGKCNKFHDRSFNQINTSLSI